MIVKPYSDGNSTKAIAVGVQFSQECSDEQMKNVIDIQAKSNFSKGFYIKKIESLTFQITQNQQPTHMQSLGGIALEKHGEDGKVERNYSFRKEAITAATINNFKDFISFNDFMHKSKEFFSLPVTSIKDIEVYCLIFERYDEFLIEGDIADDWKIQALKENSYIPQYISSKAGYWHCHQGFFEKRSNKDILCNVLIDVTRDDDQGIDKLVIRSKHSIMMNNNRYEDVLSDMSGLLEGEYSSNKRMLESILHPNLLVFIK